MRKALFVIPALAGHLNPTLALARHLQATGFSVTYFGFEAIRESVTSQGFDFIPSFTSTFGSGSETLFNRRKPYGYLADWLDRFTNDTYQNRQKEIEALVEFVKPDYVFNDILSGTDFIIFYPLRRKHPFKFFFIQTMLPSDQYPNAPPNNCLRLPPTHSRERTSLRLKWLTRQVRLKLTRLGNAVRYFGYSDLLLVSRMMKAAALPGAYALDLKKAFGVGFSNVPELILAPACFDWPGIRRKPYQYYCGYFVDENREKAAGPGHPALAALLGKLSTTDREARKVVYVSLGTIHEAHTDASGGFYARVIETLGQERDLTVVISAGKKLCPSGYERPRENVHLFSEVNQLQMLKQADLFITHGGLNSIMESIHCHVPLLVYPLNDVWDQQGNAARVHYFGIGTYGDIRKDPGRVIAGKTRDVLSGAGYKSNVVALSQQMRLYAVRDVERILDAAATEWVCP